jgi:hypothetical protein
MDQTDLHVLRAGDDGEHQCMDESATTRYLQQITVRWVSAKLHLHLVGDGQPDAVTTLQQKWGRTDAANPCGPP